MCVSESVKVCVSESVKVCVSESVKAVCVCVCAPLSFAISGCTHLETFGQEQTEENRGHIRETEREREREGGREREREGEREREMVRERWGGERERQTARERGRIGILPEEQDCSGSSASH